MGGGAAIRNVGKVAALAAARRHSLPPAAAAAAANTVHVVPAGGEPQNSVSIIASENERVHPAGTQWPALEFDDWEFAGGREDEEEAALFGFGSDVVDPPPRIVFGSVPTMEEAMEATSDLKQALEGVYSSAKVSQVPEPVESAVICAIPKHVGQAFSLLQGNPEAQNVVASLASDKNVWEAIMKNEMVMDFYKKHKSQDVCHEDLESEPQITGASTGTVESPLKETSEGSGFTDWVENIKLKVSDMVSSISDFLQDFMGTSEIKSQENATASTSNRDGFGDLAALGASFMALAVATILIVLVKRG
ncbi:uncharacterized protein M6B38_270020 [Iris pallida]|uniref:Uncharacterized protein n=1 Tax=Iris pallida TaxID=29817 RepID=A0AAX6I7X9_IRIPA|nr:uncharacterized protein M6B38_270020 [Iris pallida]